MNDWQARFRQQLVLESPEVQLGRFEATPADFETPTAPGHYVVALPETSVEIEPRGRDSFVTDRTMAVMYNPGDTYMRHRVDSAGDLCWWLSAREPCLRTLVGAARPTSKLFSRHLAPCPATAFVRSRLVAYWALNEVETHGVAEHLARIALREIVEAATMYWDFLHAERLDSHPSRWLVLDARNALRARFREPIRVDQVARQVGCSVYYLCRVFKLHTGLSVHQYKLELRLRESLDELMCSGPGRIWEIGSRQGFASHSHFSAAFARRFGVRPGELLAIRSDASLLEKAAPQLR